MFRMGRLLTLFFARCGEGTVYPEPPRDDTPWRSSLSNRIS